MSRGKERRKRINKKFESLATLIRFMRRLNFKAVRPPYSGDGLHKLVAEIDHRQRRQANSPERRYKT